MILINFNCRERRGYLSHKRYILSTGGTGGHIFPAIAVANAILLLRPDAEILFVGANGGMENTLIPEAGHKILSVTVSGIYRRMTLRNFLRNLTFPFKYISGLWQASRILRIFQPDVVAGFGGFASAPTLRMAVNLGIPAALHESNAYPGMVNRMMSKSVQVVMLGIPFAQQYLKAKTCIITGNPVREFLALGDREAGLKAFHLQGDKPIVFMTGGSLGARSMNEAMMQGIHSLIENGVQVIWQCGRLYAEEFENKTRGLNGVCLRPFIQEIHHAYACADVVISRAGAMTISEIAWMKKPAILIPSPNVAEDHQTHNAASLTELGAAIMIRDEEAKEKLVPEIISILNNKDKYASLKEQLNHLPYRDAAQHIAEILISLAEGRLVKP